MKSMNFACDTRESGTPQEHDVVTVNGIEFATIAFSSKDNVYVAHALAGKQARQDVAYTGTREKCFEKAVAYAIREGLG